MAAAKRGHTYVAEALKAFMQTTGEDPEEARHVQLQPSPEIERLDASINQLARIARHLAANVNVAELEAPCNQCVPKYMPDATRV